jgi:autotransporter-associated beta strand protein
LTPNTGNISGGMTFQGSGVTTLAGASTYSGATNIQAGTLALSTSTTNNIPNSTLILAGDTLAHNAAILDATGVSNASGLVLQSGQTLAGFGTVKAPSNGLAIGTGSTISAGNGTSGTSTPGLLTTTGGSGGATTSSQVWNAGGTYAWKVNPAVAPSGSTAVVTNGVGTTDPGTSNNNLPGTNWDMLAINALSIQSSNGSPFTINIVPTTTSTFGATNPYTIADVTSGTVTIGGTTTTYGNSPAAATALTTALQGLQSTGALVVNVPPSLGNSSEFLLSAIADGTNGNDIVVTYNGAPEPTSLALLGVGAAGLLLQRRRKTRSV